MIELENKITNKNIEQARNAIEFEQRAEIEHKLTPEYPGRLTQLFKAEARPIEQLYLSTPADEFSLRLRCEYTEEGPQYTATLKDRGELSHGALKRTEITTPITEAAYRHYQGRGAPSLRKLRAEPFKGVTIDFHDDSLTPIIVEVEHPDVERRVALKEAIETISETTLTDYSGNPFVESESLAYRHEKQEYTPSPPESLENFAHRVLSEMVGQYASGRHQVVVGLTGMSGSGKTTVTKAISEHLVELYGEAYAPIVLSTDDYHFGKNALEQRYGAPYTEWDDAKTYDTAKLAEDLRRTAEGTPLMRRHFDFETEEPILGKAVAPSPFIILEGLYASSKDLDSVRSLHFELPTSIATSIGRDVRRLVIESRANRVFPTPESRLRYQIETALPLYASLERPARNTFSASVRPMAERAFMLSRLQER